MQTLRHKSQLYILIIFILMIAIVIIAPVNHRPVLPISANNRKVSLKPSTVNVPSSFWVVQRTRKEGSGGVSNLTKSSLLSNFENNNNHSFASILNKSIDIALVAPTFTVAAYDNNSFYAFYKLHANIPAGRNVTSNLDFLSRKLTNQD